MGCPDERPEAIALSEDQADPSASGELHVLAG